MVNVLNKGPGRERTSQNAKLNAASMRGNARGSNCGRELKDDISLRGAVVPHMEIIPPTGCVYSREITFG